LNKEFLRKYFNSIKDEMGGLTSPAIFKASVVSTKIGSSRGSADEGLVDAESNAWDNSSAPRIDWDAMVDNCEGRGQQLNVILRRK